MTDAKPIIKPKKQMHNEDFPSGVVVKNPPANAKFITWTVKSDSPSIFPIPVNRPTISQSSDINPNFGIILTQAVSGLWSPDL